MLEGMETKHKSRQESPGARYSVEEPTDTAGGSNGPQEADFDVKVGNSNDYQPSLLERLQLNLKGL
jgi:hypothetical protein